MKNQLAEIREYCLFWPGQATQKATTTQAIFYKGLMTNFWRDKNPTDSGFHINQSEEELQKWCELINQGKVKPSKYSREFSEEGSIHFDSCTSVKFKPKKIFVVQGDPSIDDKEQMKLWGLNYKYYVSALTSRSGQQRTIEEVRQEVEKDNIFHTQYTKIFHTTSLKLMENIVVFVYKYGYCIYATPLNEIPKIQTS